MPEYSSDIPFEAIDGPVNSKALPLLCFMQKVELSVHNLLLSSFRNCISTIHIKKWAGRIFIYMAELFLLALLQ